MSTSVLPTTLYDHAPDRSSGAASWRLAAAGLAIVFLQRSLLCLMGWARGTHALFKWDAVWYRKVATHGYSYIPPGTGRPVPSSLAFFPLFPGTASALHRVTGLGIDASLELLSLAGLVMAVWGITAVGTLIADRRTGLLLTALWGAAPRGLVTIIPYTEGIFTAMAVWCMYALLRKRWWQAAAICAIAGLTRSAAITLMGTLAVAWLRDRWRHLGSVRGILQALSLAALSSSGLLAYIAYVGHRTGHWDGYVRVQHAWYMQMGSPLVSLTQIPHIWHMHREWWVFNYTVIPSLIGLALAVGALLARPGLELGTFTALSTLWTWCAKNYFWCKPRFQLPVFTLGLLPARVLARAPMPVIVIVVGLLTGWSCVADVHQWAAHGAP